MEEGEWEREGEARDCEIAYVCVWGGCVCVDAGEGVGQSEIYKTH